MDDGIALFANWFIDQVIQFVVELPFSRDMESEADEVGLQMAAKACFDVREAPAFWGKMQLLSENPMENDSDFEFISTHPCHSTRQSKLTDLLADALRLRWDCGCERLDPKRDPNQELLLFKAYLKQQSGKEEQEKMKNDKRVVTQHYTKVPLNVPTNAATAAVATNPPTTDVAPTFNVHSVATDTE